MSDTKPRKFLTYPAVIDWLQWAEHPDKLGSIDGPQVTLLLIKEYRDEIKELTQRLEACERERDALREKLDQIKGVLDELFYEDAGDSLTQKMVCEALSILNAEKKEKKE